ncbi:hypothetical protein V8C86DRAFT_2939848 [Haematococcus lacustris]
MRLQRPHSVPHTSQQLLPREVHRRARPAASHCPRAQPLSTSNMRRRGSIAQAVEDEAPVARPATAPSGSAQGPTRGGQGTAAPQLQLDRWAFTSTLAVSGAGLGTLLDGIHSRVGLQQYDWMPLQLGGLATSAAVPPLLAMFYCVAAARSSDVTWVAISFGVLAAQLQLSAWAYASGAPLDQLTALLAAVALASWWVLDGTKQGLALAALVAVGAPAAELLLLHWLPLWHYPRADILGGQFVSFVPCCYGGYTPALAALARFLRAVLSFPPDGQQQQQQQQQGGR